ALPISVGIDALGRNFLPLARRLNLHRKTLGWRTRTELGLRHVELPRAHSWIGRLGGHTADANSKDHREAYQDLESQRTVLRLHRTLPPGGELQGQSSRNGNHLPFSEQKPNANDAIGGSCKHHMCAVSLGVASGVIWDIGASVQLALG